MPSCDRCFVEYHPDKLNVVRSMSVEGDDWVQGNDVRAYCDSCWSVLTGIPITKLIKWAESDAQN